MRKFFAELKRRKVYRVAISYAVIAWLLIQIDTQVFPFFTPTWVVKLIIVLVVLGFPVALVLSWIFDFTMEGIKRTSDQPAFEPLSIPDKSIAVLPFENLSDDQQNTYLADGIQDDILSNLAKIADLKVISRTSVRQYRGVERNLRDIGAALGVAHILEGTVRRIGNRLRVNAQLINARTDAHIWAETFDREITDLFVLQSDLAEQIANQLRANLSPEEKASMQIHPTADLDAYDLYLRARDLFRWSGSGDPKENGEKALRLLEEALARDPKFALAHALASRFHGELYWFGYERTRERLARARVEAETALKLRPELGDARLAMAYYYYFGGRHYDLALREFEIARQATPNDAEIWDGIGAVERRRGRWDQAIAYFERAWQLDPRNPSVIWNLGETYASMRRYQEAERLFIAGFKANANAHLFPLILAANELKKTGSVDALDNALKMVPRDFNPGGAVTTVAVRIALMQRDPEKAAKILAASGLEELNDGGIGGMATMLDGYTFPRTWYDGWIARLRGDNAGAKKAFEQARMSVEDDARVCSCDEKPQSLLGLIDAALGRNEDAIVEARRATEILPIEKDAYDGPILATNLAVVYAQTGKIDEAVSLLEKLVRLPNGPTAGLLKAEPEWDPLRSDRRFQALIDSDARAGQSGGSKESSPQ
ncbi:MAG TPA: tetratricopeptide repeat protein [Chthoniobacterales bacterium]|nr:tetratricopeptide repeat protein [Chthoniobacterales bacterium]